jgi:YegS/Rv2252/BmrU family lipid kinase
VTAARAVFVVNPASDHGGTGRAWPAIAAAARGRGLEVVERLTEAPGHATALVREALAAGEELIVAVGGDGTVNEVANGFCDERGEPLPTAAALAVVERGTGCDFIRTYRIPKSTGAAVALIADGRRRRIDLGRARYEGAAGSETRLFANVASCGMTGDVARRANASSNRFGGTAGFLWATAAAFGAWQNVPFRVSVDGVDRSLLANDVVCANGRYFGGAIRIAPYAEPDDGLLDVLLIGDVSKVDLALNLGRLYRGTLGEHPKVLALRGREVVCEPARALPVEIDGEQPGTTPIRFDVVPAALSLVVPHAR